MTSRKKIYYIPGMISLIGLPILIYFFIPKPAAKLNSIKIFLPYDNISDNKWTYYFSKQNFYKSISKRKVTEVDLFEDDLTLRNYVLQEKFNFIERELERISFTGDTTTVLKINLSDSNTIGDFVWPVNQTLLYNIRRWMIADNSFYFVNIKYPFRKITETHQLLYPTL